MLTNKAYFFNFDLLSGDGGTTTWTIFMCHLFCFSFCWWDLICRFILGTVFSFQVFFPTLNSLFVILFHFQERKKAQQVCQLSQCYRESPSLNKFDRVFWIIKGFSLLQKNISFGNYFICYLKRFILTYEIIHTTESTIKYCRLKNTEWNITVTDWKLFSYFSCDNLFNNHNFKTNTQEKTDNEVTETSTSPKKYSMIDYFKCRYHLTLFRMGLFGATHVLET